MMLLPGLTHDATFLHDRATHGIVRSAHTSPSVHLCTAQPIELFVLYTSYSSLPLYSIGTHASIGRHGGDGQLATSIVSQNVPGGQNLSTQAQNRTSRVYIKRNVEQTNIQLFYR